MNKNDSIKLLLPNRRYICLDTVILFTFYLTVIAAVVVGIQLFLISLGIKFWTLVDLRLLEPYLSMDSNILICVSILFIFCSIFGILSIFQYSYIGNLTSVGIFVLLIIFTDVYALSNYRIKDYISQDTLYRVLHDSIIKNPFENIEFHLMQKRLSCCGINNYTDWQYVLPFIPGSCCESSTICTINDPTLNQDGCLPKIQAILSNIYEHTIAILIAFNVVGVIGIFSGYFCSYLLRQLKKGGKILHTMIPRIRIHNAGNGQQTEEVSNVHNKRPSIQIISGHVIPSDPTPTYSDPQKPSIQIISDHVIPSDPTPMYSDPQKPSIEIISDHVIPSDPTPMYSDPQKLDNDFNL